MWDGTILAGCGGGSSGTTPGGSTDAAQEDVTTEGAATCPTGQKMCGTTCAVTSEDPANCGSCGTACAAGMVCSQGACATSCSGGTTQCGQSCVETGVDPSNCGACGKKCGASEACFGGACKSDCAAGQTVCAGDGGGSFCTNTASDYHNCGSCGNACPVGKVCSAGACSTSCQPSETLCVLDGKRQLRRLRRRLRGGLRLLQRSLQPHLQGRSRRLQRQLRRPHDEQRLLRCVGQLPGHQRGYRLRGLRHLHGQRVRAGYYERELREPVRRMDGLGLVAGAEHLWNLGNRNQRADDAAGAKVLDYYTMLSIAETSPGLPITYTATDGNAVSLLLVNGPEEHRVYQTVVVPVTASSLAWDMMCNNQFTAFDPTNQYLALNIRDRTTDAILATITRRRKAPTP